MELTATGLGSGLDVKGLVDQLVAAERQPVSNRLNLREARANAELSALGKFKSALASFEESLDALSELEKFQQRITSVSDDTLITASADSAAVPGRYSVQVGALATAQKIASGPFASADAAVGDGQLSISVAGATANIIIDPTANTLADIRDAINDSLDNPGVLATIVNATDGAHLVLSSAETGALNTITVAATGGDGGLDQLIYDAAAPSNPMTELEAAADAEVRIDGFTVRSATNDVAGAIEGVTINLLEADPGELIDLSVDFDQTAANAAVGAFVNAYNSLIDTIKEVTAFNAETGEAAPLLGDSVVRGVKDSLRRALGNAFDIPGASFRTLADIGITTEASGNLELDDTKLSESITASFDGVGELFANADGIVAALQVRLEGVMSSTGPIDARETRLKDQLEFLGDQRTRLDERMERVRERLLDQFNAMDRLVASLQNTSAFLARELG
ncbi:MAG: flagellar filament capping protein FliD [Gammaproteobacteria bacterium]|nr:flagellar filament capping protein FliD [Gammaproteobacteria bacterium]